MRSVRNAAAAVAASISISACATPYQPTGFAGGFESNWLASDVLAVEVRGNGFTTDQRVKDYSLLQAAQRAQEAGYSHFTTVNAENLGGSQTYMNTINNNFNAQTIYKPGRGIVVKMYRQAPEGYMPSQYYVVADVLATLGPKYLK